MRRTVRCIGIVFGIVSLGALANAQGRGEPGKSIGTITTQGGLIVLTLDEGVLGKANMFDLVHHTLRFTPEGSRYRVENVPFHWDADFGPQMAGSQATLKNFAFPFSGKTWNSFSVGVTGSMTFGQPPAGVGGAAAGGGGGRGGGISVDRFATLHDAARNLINAVPAISVFFKPRMNGMRYLKELEDRAVITWSLTEPVGGVQDMTWTPTVNKFQAVLQKDGTIELAYDDVAAKDAIVGVYPVVTEGTEKEIATIASQENSAVPAHLDIKSIKLAAVNGLFLKATIETRGPVLLESDPGIAGVLYRICLNARKPADACDQNAHADAIWTIQGGGAGGRGGRDGGGGPRYNASGTGVSPGVKIAGNTISIEGTLPEGTRAGDQIYVYAASQTRGTPAVTVDQVTPQAVKLAALGSPAVDLSSVKKDDGPFAAVYEAFHYMKPTRSVDLTCTVIKALGDKFDFLAFYSDFRIDNPEAGTSSSGPRGGGPNGGAVTGIAANQGNLAGYCSQGRAQWQYIQPVYVGANQMQERPPAGMTDRSDHNIAGYDHQLGERMPDGHMPPYDYAISQIGHEMGHRWGMSVSVKIKGEVTRLSASGHWDRGLQAQVAFPYQRPVEASAMGGGVWQDNFDGTFTQLDDDYYVPATGWSYLDLYLMGLIAPSEVPDFFILRNLVPAGRDPNGHPIFKADRIKLSVQDVISVEGPRVPDVDHSQKQFNTAMVVVVEHGNKPSKELIEKTNAIAARWVDYWATTTGHRASMTTNPK